MNLLDLFFGYFDLATHVATRIHDPRNLLAYPGRLLDPALDLKSTPAPTLQNHQTPLGHRLTITRWDGMRPVARFRLPPRTSPRCSAGHAAGRQRERTGGRFQLEDYPGWHPSGIGQLVLGFCHFHSFGTSGSLILAFACTCAGVTRYLSSWPIAQ